MVFDSEGLTVVLVRVKLEIFLLYYAIFQPNTGTLCVFPRPPAFLPQWALLRSAAALQSSALPPRGGATSPATAEHLEISAPLSMTLQGEILVPFNQQRIPTLVSEYLYQKQHLPQLPAALGGFGGTPECTSLLADEHQLVNRSGFSAVAGQRQSGPCRPRRCWPFRSQQSETSPQSPPRLPLCS